MSHSIPYSVSYSISALSHGKEDIARDEWEELGKICAPSLHLSSHPYTIWSDVFDTMVTGCLFQVLGLAPLYINFAMKTLP
jgi:hypothetical protein